jgi:membrane protease YdiL (CAAX protease family)
MFGFVMVMLRAMHSDAGLWVEAGLLIFAFFVVVPSIAALIGFAAWKGKPKNFNREMYWTAFAAATVLSLFLMVIAQRMHADVRTWQYPVQVACFGLGALLFGVAGGCMIGIFTSRRGVENQEPHS